MRPVLLLIVLAALTLALPRPTTAQSRVLTVNSASDVGDGVCDQTCTLRDALLASNANSGPDLIRFAIGRGPVIIAPSTPLPTIHDPGTIIDGTSQPGDPSRPRIMLDGRDAGAASGLVSSAPDVQIRGLAVGNFERYGLAAIGDAADRNSFLANWVGLALDGRTAAPNRTGGIAVLLGAGDARIGDDCTGCGNRIAGNAGPERTGHGVLVAGSGSVGARIAGNVIGLDIDGEALPNDDGILIVDDAHATVGGSDPNAGNVLSGNAVAGIEVRETGALALRIEGNLIGLDESGTEAVPNDVGVFVHGDARGVFIGGPAANVIAGNRVGIAIERRAQAITVQGNRIGLDVSGRRAVPNRENGISVVAGARDVQIGGPADGEGNWIVGSSMAIVIEGFSTRDVRVTGNVIGLALDETTPLPNSIGIRVMDADDVEIGGRERGEGNVIVASEQSGIEVVTVAEVRIRGNRIGLRPDDVSSGNGVGITLRRGTTGAIIEENRIAASAGAGVVVLDANTQRNRITRNAFLDNDGPAIDLGGDGLTPNDPDDADAGPNGLFNAPVILDVVQGGTSAAVTGTARPRALVELYRLAPGEFVGAARADNSGAWTTTVPLPPGGGLSAIAIAASGDTSEFSEAFVPERPIMLDAGFTPTGWFGPQSAAAAAFASLGERLVAAFRYDASRQEWDAYRPGLPFVSTLVALDRGDALWVLLTPGEAVVWAQPTGSNAARILSLQTGLNFVTWTGPPTSAGEALFALVDSVVTVLRWNPERKQFDTVFPELPIAGLASELQPRDVLWVRVDGRQVWRQPAP